MDTRNNQAMNVKMLQKSISGKMMMLHIPKKKDDKMSNRFLITVNVLGSAGPLRFIVNEDDTVSEVIDAALKLYARGKRLPVLGSDVNHVLLYSANAGFDALHLSESVGSQGVRNFVLCKKEKHPHMTEARSEIGSRKRSGCFKAWFNKSLSFNFKISSN